MRSGSAPAPTSEHPRAPLRERARRCDRGRGPGTGDAPSESAGDTVASGACAMVHEDDDDVSMLAEMESHLAAIHGDARGDARRELDALYLLAVERETLAVVGYGGDEVQRRVRRLHADPLTLLVVSRALRWASREERSHVILARGLLARSGGFIRRTRALAADLGGLVAGWCAAVLQHTTWRRAPASHLLATIVAFLGRMAGKVPPTAGTALRAQTFRAFCRFQMAAEQTAVISWERIAGVLAGDPGVAALAPIAARIAADERHHRAVLSVLREAFDDADHLRDGHDAESLARAIAEVDRSFVAPVVAGGPRDEPIGRGGPVFVRESASARSADRGGLRALLRTTLVDTGLLAQVFADAPAAPRVAVKTTFMMSYDRRDPSTHVDLALAEELALLLREYGASSVNYLEAPNHFDRFYTGRSVAEVARYLGFESEHYQVVDVSSDQVTHAFRRGIGQDSVSRTWRDAEVRIAFGKMRTHPSWLVHLTMNGLESLGRRVDELIFRDRQAELMAGMMMLVDAFPPHLGLLDATHHVPDGLTGILGDPHPSHPGRLYAARDPLALDLVAARHMGISQFPTNNALALALDWFDDPRPRSTVDGIDTPLAPFLGPHRNDATVFLSALAYPAYMLGDNHGSFWMPTMDPTAFPPRTRPSLPLRCVRALLRGMFGFGSPPSARS